MKVAFVLFSSTAQAITTNQINNFNQRAEDALSACNLYMEKAITCQPPKRKIPKYTNRIQSVMLDAVHHMKVGKCEKRRYRREDFGDYEISDFTTEPIDTTEENEWITTGKFSDKLEVPDFDFNKVESELTGLQSRLDRQVLPLVVGYGGGGNRQRFESDQEEIDNPRGLESKIMNGFFDDYQEPGGEMDAGEHHRMETGLFDDDYADNSFDRNLPTMFEETDIQDNERGYNGKVMTKLEAKCRQQTIDLFDGNLLQSCKKVNGWKKRISHLLDDLTRMKKTCIKQDYLFTVKDR